MMFNLFYESINIHGFNKFISFVAGEWHAKN